MDINYIHKNNSEKLILFFNGWGCDSNAVKHLIPGDFDVLHIGSYTNPLSNIKINDTYKEINIIAWSMGVFASNIMSKEINKRITKRIAINGTAFPMHNTYGIPVDIFRGTLKMWNEKNKQKFNSRMFASNTESTQFSHLISNRDCINQVKELEDLYNLIKEDNQPSQEFDKVIIGKNDLIFPYSNQLNFWGEKNNIIIETSWPHFPFHKIESWNNILDLK